MGELTANAIKKLKVAELKAELSKRGLAVKGKKDDLAKRLLEAIESEEQQIDADEVVATTSEDNANQDVDTTGEEDGTDVVMADDGPTATQETSQNATDSAVVQDEEKSSEIGNKGDAVTIVQNGNEEDKEKSAPENENNDSDDWVMIDDAEVKEAAKGAEQLTSVQTDNTETTEKSGETESKIEVLPSDSVEKVEEKGGTETEMEVSVVAVGDDGVKDDTKEQTVLTPSADVGTADSSQNEEKKKAEKNEEEDKKQKKSVVLPPDVMVDVENEDGEDEDPPEIAEGHVALDGHSSDLHFIISKSGLSGRNLIKNGFNYMWAGARANKGAKAGKIGYELKIVKQLEVELVEKESPVHAVRVGWSIENASLQLGEAVLSYGYESTGKVCASSKFIKYGETFGVGDVIGTFLDLESEKKTLCYTKNGVELGVAVSLNLNLDEKPLFPHIFIRNMEVELNFGNEKAWFDAPEGYSLLQNAGSENIAESEHQPSTTAEECEVLLMIGLPNSGKSTWVRKYVESHVDKQFNVIGINQVLERCKLEGKSRQKSDPGHENLMAAVMKVLTKLYQICPKKKRNFIYDQNNVYEISQTTKMAPFVGIKKKAVVVVPTHDNLRRRTSDAKRKGDNIHDVPFADLCDMKCEFHLPEVGELFDEIIFPELDERNAGKTVRDYQSDGSRAKRTGRDEYYPKRRPRNDERSYARRDGYGGRDRHDDGWRNSGSGYGGYGGSYGSGGYKQRSSYGSGYHNNRSSGGHYGDPNRRSGGGGGGGGYRQQNYGGSGYRSGNYGSSGYGTGYGGGGGYGSYGSNSYGGGYNYNNYNSGSYGRGGSNTGGQLGQYNAAGYNQSGQNQQWGSNSGGWSGYNYGNYGGGNSGYSY